jgi:hypothetical protein
MRGIKRAWLGVVRPLATRIASLTQRGDMIDVHSEQQRHALD